ncbi:hypothetical protein F5Y11DRAFT_351066 [Daldinia sp. FL1419]|nr:hypothetical protein F5Y11DRAFT_351066 [Daldinia sp. FL1419]
MLPQYSCLILLSFAGVAGPGLPTPAPSLFIKPTAQKMFDNCYYGYVRSTCENQPFAKQKECDRLRKIWPAHKTHVRETQAFRRSQLLTGDSPGHDSRIDDRMAKARKTKDGEI